MTIFPLEQGKNGQAPAISLPGGLELPVVGLGTYSLYGSTCVNAVRTALAKCYRLAR